MMHLVTHFIRVSIAIEEGKFYKNHIGILKNQFNFTKNVGTVYYVFFVFLQQMLFFRYESSRIS
jgi:hypothetical protein